MGRRVEQEAAGDRIEGTWWYREYRKRGYTEAEARAEVERMEARSVRDRFPVVGRDGKRIKRAA